MHAGKVRQVVVILDIMHDCGRQLSLFSILELPILVGSHCRGLA